MYDAPPPVAASVLTLLVNDAAQATNAGSAWRVVWRMVLSLFSRVAEAMGVADGGPKCLWQAGTWRSDEHGPENGAAHPQAVKFLCALRWWGGAPSSEPSDSARTPTAFASIPAPLARKFCPHHPASPRPTTSCSAPPRPRTSNGQVCQRRQSPSHAQSTQSRRRRRHAAGESLHTAVDSQPACPSSRWCPSRR